LKNWKVDDAGSVVFDDSGSIELVDKEERIAQSIRLGVLTWKGSHFDDPNFGIDYERIYNNPDDIPIEQVLQMEINSFFASGFDPELISFSFISIERFERDYIINGRYGTIYGTTNRLREKVEFL
jgi:hypothetical protein